MLYYQVNAFGCFDEYDFFQILTEVAVRLGCSRQGVDQGYAVGFEVVQHRIAKQAIPSPLLTLPTDEGTLTKHHDAEWSRALRASGDHQLAFLRSVPRYRVWIDAARKGMVGKKIRKRRKKK